MNPRLGPDRGTVRAVSAPDANHDYRSVLREVSVNVRTQRKKRPKVRFCLVFERESLSIPAMRKVLGDTLREVGVNEDSVADIVLAATEACTNVVLHAGHSVPVYEVAATVGRGACRVEVTDAGGGCRRPRFRAPRARGGRWRPAGGLAESGRGFTIMRACVDDVRLRSSPGRGTRVVLDKRIHWEAPPARPVLSPG